MVQTGDEKQSIEDLKKTIDELNQEKQQIISIVSHDIKAPLNRIYALVELLSMGAENLTAEQQQYVDKMHQVVADGLSMIRNLVDYRNIQYRGIDLNPEQISISDFIESKVRSFRSLADKKNITINFTATGKPLIVSDNQCLIRIFDSLLSNAIKFSGENKEVFVSVVDGTDHVQIRVKDQARGFKKDELNKLFQKFQKLAAKPTSGESSTGLGLFVAKEFIDKIGGTINCETEEGVGSTFVVSLPK
jgi:signal transduction histidine kinase